MASGVRNRSHRKKHPSEKRIKFAPFLALKLMSGEHNDTIWWEDREKRIFSVRWQHLSSKNAYDNCDSNHIIYKYAEHTRKLYEPKREDGKLVVRSFTKQKQNFRNASKKCTDVVPIELRKEERIGVFAKKSWQFTSDVEEMVKPYIVNYRHVRMKRPVGRPRKHPIVTSSKLPKKQGRVGRRRPQKDNTTEPYIYTDVVKEDLCPTTSYERIIFKCMMCNYMCDSKELLNVHTKLEHVKLEDEGHVKLENEEHVKLENDDVDVKME